MIKILSSVKIFDIPHPKPDVHLSIWLPYQFLKDIDVLYYTHTNIFKTKKQAPQKAGKQNCAISYFVLYYR